MAELKKLNKKTGGKPPENKDLGSTTEIVLVGFNDWQAIRLGVYLTCGSMIMLLLVFPAIAVLTWIIFIIAEIVLF